MKIISVILQELLVRNDLPAWWHAELETDPDEIKKLMIQHGVTTEKGFQDIITKIKARKKQLKILKNA